MAHNHVLPMLQNRANRNDEQLITEKKYKFPIESSMLEVTIKENCCADYSSITWPAAPVLSQFMIKHRSIFTGKRVLELGSGTGLCGIVAALLGNKVILTDSHNARQKSNLLDVNVSLNGLIIGTDDAVDHLDPETVHIFPLTWGRFTRCFFMIPTIDFLIASDCFYDPDDFEDILMTVAYFMTRDPESVFYTTYQVRNSSWNIECALKKWNLNCECLHVDYEDDVPEYQVSQGQQSRSTIIVYRITRSPRPLQ